MTKDSQTNLLYEQVAKRLESQIRAGVYGVGERIPSIRSLRERERVSVGTIMQAISILEANGMVEARPCSGYYVARGRLGDFSSPAPATCKLEPHTVDVSDVVAQVIRQAGDETRVPLGAGVPAPSLLPVEKLSRYLAAAVREHPENLGRYGSSFGHPEYHRQLLRRFATIGCNVLPEELVGTVGATEALNLAIRSVTKPGDVVAVESPCYFGFLEILESLRLKALPVPALNDEGIDLELLAEAIEKHPVKAVLLVPTYNNPNGTCLPEAKRRQLLSLLADHDLPLIEDDIYGDMQFGEERLRPVKGFDDDGRVLNCGSFSKSLSPGLRVGWIAAGRYAEKVKRLKMITTSTSPAVNQIAVARFLENGAMDRHLRGLRRAFHTQVLQVSDAVRNSFPKGTALSQPKGGFFLWIQLPDGVDALDVYREANLTGVHVVPGSIFSPHGKMQDRIRISCGFPVDDRIQKGIQRLGVVVQKLHRKGMSRRLHP